MDTILDFEKPIIDLSEKLAELKELSGDELTGDIEKIQERYNHKLESIYTKLTPWQKTQVARHPDRPHFSDIAQGIFSGFTPLAGDRRFAEDKAILGGPAVFGETPVMIIGNEKGFDTESRVAHNFGMARPEGYRKAQRLMRLAERFSMPIISFVDTAGAWPGIDAEERGQAQAIAESIDICLDVNVPFLSFIIGEGGSGGAIALASANKVYMLEHAIYSVISPEGCASILWRDSGQNKTAADALKLTAQDLLKLKVIDGIVDEPIGGAHRNLPAVFDSLKPVITDFLNDYSDMDKDKIKQERREKFLAMSRL